MNIARTQQAADQHERLALAARRFVSQTFFGTILKQMRDSPFKSEMFSGGRGGETFSAMLDFHLAERMSAGPGRKLAESMVRRIEGRGGEDSAGLKAEAPWARLAREARSDVAAAR